MRSELSLDLSSPTTLPLETRMAEFKEDPQKMDVMINFVDEVLVNAQNEAEQKLDKDKKDNLSGKVQPDARSLFAGIKRGRIVTRARGIVLRLFDAICNCTSSGPVAPPPPSSSSASGNVGGGGGAAAYEQLPLSTKTDQKP